jgi:DNA-binding response OmpR family regulator
MIECKTHILLLDDDPEELELIQKYFDSSHIGNYRMFSSVQEFFDCFSDDVFLAIIDYNLNTITAKEVVEKIHDLNDKRKSVAKCEIIVISGTDDIKIPIYFFNYRKSDYFLRKSHNESFYMELVLFTQQAIDRQMGLDGTSKVLDHQRRFYESL